MCSLIRFALVCWITSICCGVDQDNTSDVVGQETRFGHGMCVGRSSSNRFSTKYKVVKCSRPYHKCTCTNKIYEYPRCVCYPLYTRKKPDEEGTVEPKPLQEKWDSSYVLGIGGVIVGGVILISISCCCAVRAWYKRKATVKPLRESSPLPPFYSPPPPYLHSPLPDPIPTRITLSAPTPPLQRDDEAEWRNDHDLVVQDVME